MERRQTLTPALSRERERGQDSQDSLSRLRERAGVRARELRKEQTDAEALLWSRLRNRQLSGLKFRRQRPIANYIADFACLEIGLVVELDGGQHAEQIAYDERREHEMRSEGFQTLRFWNHEVLNETDAVMEKIRQVAESLALTPTLSRRREREQEDRSQT
jgi:very-short-patch-repair endonuclease